MSASLDMLPDDYVEKIIAEYEARQAAEKIADDARKRAERALHYQRCMEYDDALAAARADRPRWRDRRRRCKVGIHKTRWSPCWVKGTYGFCIHCGTATGGGVGGY